MKKTYRNLLAAALIAPALAGQAQIRYVEEIFTDAQIKVDTSVEYGQNYSILPTILASLSLDPNPPLPTLLPLVMDVYYPDTDIDELEERPLFIYLPTGNFLPPVVNGSPQGSRKDSSAVNMARQLAKRGYVCAVADYRLGWVPVSPNQLVRTGTILNAAYKGQQDSKAAVRYFRKDRNTDNIYKIDPSRIGLIGEGTGAYVAMAHAYLDKPWKIGRLPGLGGDKFLANINPASAIDTSVVDTNRVGNFDGTDNIPLDLTDFALSGGDFTKVTGNVANHPEYSSAINLVISMGGALGDTSWLDPGQVPLIGIQAVRDPNAPYNIGDVIVPTTGDLVIPFASGAGFNVQRMNELGNNVSFADKVYNDPITVAVEARYNKSISLGTGTINTGSGKGLLPFILTEAVPMAKNHGAPWQFWSSTQLTAIAPNPFQPSSSTHQIAAGSNPFMAQSDALGRSMALSYIDTIQQYIHPRVVCAFDLEECGLFTSISDQPVKSTFSVYPNPAQHSFVVSAGGKNIESIKLFDLQGRVAISRSVGAARVDIERSNLSAGVYLLEVISEGKSSFGKVILE